MTAHVTLMGTKGSRDFDEARKALQGAGVKVTEVDFRESVASAYLFKDLGVRGTTVLLVNGEHTISGLADITKFAKRCGSG
ncbi:MAG: DsbA family protein [Anaerolineae bacterium]|nr:DsbA family protein [Anaerolineae bacterium]